MLLDRAITQNISHQKLVFSLNFNVLFYLIDYLFPKWVPVRDQIIGEMGNNVKTVIDKQVTQDIFITNSYAYFMSKNI